MRAPLLTRRSNGTADLVAKRRPLEINDIAQIKSLLPHLITFAYIDSELLRVHSAGGDDAAAKRAQKTRELDEAYALAGAGQDPESKPKKKEIVLLFSFNDGEIKATSGGSRKPA